jgi:hypothetical protein
VVALSYAVTRIDPFCVPPLEVALPRSNCA